MEFQHILHRGCLSGDKECVTGLVSLRRSFYTQIASVWYLEYEQMGKKPFEYPPFLLPKRDFIRYK